MLAYDIDARAVHTEVFDGPLELLLFLVRREGVDLRDVRIAPVTDAYLAQLEVLQSLDLDVAGEFIVLAATLCLLKSRELLPRRPALDDEVEEPDDLREQLVRRLLEYERYRDAADQLASRPMLGRDTFVRPVAPPDEADRPVVPGVDALGLLEVFYKVLQRHAEPPPVHSVVMEHYSLEDMASWMLTQLQGGPRTLGALLQHLKTASDRVVAFLAALEMAKLQMLDVTQDHHLGPVLLTTRVEGTDVDLSILSSGGAG